MADILVLGATGFTGRLITRYLANHPQRSSFTFGIAARSKSKLEELKRSLALDEHIYMAVVDVTQREQVEEIAKSTKVVINTVGPFWRWGDEVVRACAIYGTHYVDLTGETPFIRKMIWRYDYVATKSHAIIIPSSGLDSIPADLLVFLANKTMKAAAGPHAGLGRSLTVYRVLGGVSGGTLSSIVTSIEEVPRKATSESEQDYGLSSSIQGAPSPSTGLYYKVPHTSPAEYALPYPMSISDRAIVQRTWGLHALAAVEAEERESGAVQRLTYGPEFTYEECLVLPNLSGLFPVVVANLTFLVGFAMLYLLPPARWLFKRVVPQPGHGPSDEAMAKGFLEATNYTSSAPGAGVPVTHVKSIVRGNGDPGYLLTAIMISESALAILLDKSSLPALAHGGGILTPASALGEVLIRRLEATGRFEFESRVISPGEAPEGRKAR